MKTQGKYIGAARAPGTLATWFHEPDKISVPGFNRFFCGWCRQLWQHVGNFFLASPFINLWNDTAGIERRFTWKRTAKEKELPILAPKRSRAGRKKGGEEGGGEREEREGEVEGEGERAKRPKKKKEKEAQCPQRKRTGEGTLQSPQVDQRGQHPMHPTFPPGEHFCGNHIKRQSFGTVGGMGEDIPVPEAQQKQPQHLQLHLKKAYRKKVQRQIVIALDFVWYYSRMLEFLQLVFFAGFKLQTCLWVAMLRQLFHISMHLVVRKSPYPGGGDLDGDGLRSTNHCFLKNLVRATAGNADHPIFLQAGCILGAASLGIINPLPAESVKNRIPQEKGLLWVMAGRARTLIQPEKPQRKLWAGTIIVCKHIFS